MSITSYTENLVNNGTSFEPFTFSLPLPPNSIKAIRISNNTSAVLTLSGVNNAPSDTISLQPGMVDVFAFTQSQGGVKGSFSPSPPTLVGNVTFDVSDVGPADFPGSYPLAMAQTTVALGPNSTVDIAPGSTVDITGGNIDVTNVVSIAADQTILFSGQLTSDVNGHWNTSFSLSSSIRSILLLVSTVAGTVDQITFAMEGSSTGTLYTGSNDPTINPISSNSGSYPPLLFPAYGSADPTVDLTMVAVPAVAAGVTLYLTALGLPDETIIGRTSNPLIVTSLPNTIDSPVNAVVNNATNLLVPAPGAGLFNRIGTFTCKAAASTTIAIQDINANLYAYTEIDSTVINVIPGPLYVNTALYIASPGTVQVSTWYRSINQAGVING